MPIQTYRCAYCGTQQTWDGTGTRTCSHCGATQPEPTDSTDTPAPRRSHLALYATIALLSLIAIAFLIYHFAASPSSPSSTTTASNHQAPIIDARPTQQSRIERVLDPVVRTVPAGSDLSLLDLLRSAPNSTAAMFDTRMLSITNPRAMNDIDGHLYFVGEVVNHSPDTTAIAPTVGMTLFKHGRKLESTDLEFSDLPPGAHTPAFFTWDGEPNDIDHYQFHWKPVQSYPQAQPGHPRLETAITSKTLSPSSVQVNFGPVFHYTSAEIHGTVTNRGDALAKGIQLYLVLHDAQGRITGFKEQDLQQLAPGQSVEYSITADQWDDPIATLDVTALPVSDPNLQ